MAPTITSTADYPKEHLNLTHKVNSVCNFFVSTLKICLCHEVVCIKRTNVLISCCSFCRWENPLWKRCAEIASATASSSSKLSWVHSSSTSNPTPKWRKPTSWRWLFASWDSVFSQWKPHPPLMLAVRVSPSVLKKSFTSCPGTQGKHRPMESCWPSSRPCNHPVMTTGGRVPSASWALLSSMSRVKTRVQPGAPPGGLARTHHRWDFHVIKLVRVENSTTFQSVQTCKCRGFIFFTSKNVFNSVARKRYCNFLQGICLLWRYTQFFINCEYTGLLVKPL